MANPAILRHHPLRQKSQDLACCKASSCRKSCTNLSVNILVWSSHLAGASTAYHAVGHIVRLTSACIPSNLTASGSEADTPAIQ